MKPETPAEKFTRRLRALIDSFRDDVDVADILESEAAIRRSVTESSRLLNWAAVVAAAPRTPPVKGG